MEKLEIPKEVLKAAVDFVKVAKRHKLYGFQCEFQMQEGQSEKNHVNWNWGRHGDDMNGFNVHSKLDIMENHTLNQTP